MLSPALIPGSSTPGSATAQALKSIVLHSTRGEEKWLLEEISNFNAPVKCRCFHKAASKALRDTLDETLSLALSLHTSSPLAFNANNIFVLYFSSVLSRTAAGATSRRRLLTRGSGCREKWT